MTRDHKALDEFFKNNSLTYQHVSEEFMTGDKPMRTMKELAELANLCQGGCNLSGIAISFGGVMKDLWDHARAENKGTDWVNTHPVAILFIDKMASLAGIQSDTGPVLAAYKWCDEMIKDETK